MTKQNMPDLEKVVLHKAKTADHQIGDSNWYYNALPVYIDSLTGEVAVMHVPAKCFDAIAVPRHESLPNGSTVVKRMGGVTFHLDTRGA